MQFLRHRAWPVKRGAALQLLRSKGGCGSAHLLLGHNSLLKQAKKIPLSTHVLHAWQSASIGVRNWAISAPGDTSRVSVIFHSIGKKISNPFLLSGNSLVLKKGFLQVCSSDFYND